MTSEIGSSSAGPAFCDRLEEAGRGRGAERHVGRVDRVGLAVEALDLDVDDRDAVAAAACHRLLDPEPDGGDVLLGDRPADDGVDELEPLAAGQRRHAQVDDRELAVPARLLLEPAFALDRLRDRAPELDRHGVGLDVDAVLAGQPRHGDGEMGVADATQHGASRDRVVPDLQRRILVDQPGERVRQLVVVVLGGGTSVTARLAAGSARRLDHDRLVAAARAWRRCRR